MYLERGVIMDKLRPKIPVLLPSLPKIGNARLCHLETGSKSILWLDTLLELLVLICLLVPYIFQLIPLI